MISDMTLVEDVLSTMDGNDLNECTVVLLLGKSVVALLKLSRDWMGSKWHLVLKVWEPVQDKHSKVIQNAYR